MTKKDYELIADALAFTKYLLKNAENEATPEAVLDLVSYNVAEALRSKNDKFQADKFFTACDNWRPAYINNSGQIVNYED